MRKGALAVIEAWQEAVNAGSADRVARLSAEHIQVLGPRGTATMTGSDLADWMTRSGFSATALRWYCGGAGTAVVEQAAVWTDRGTGIEQGHATVASHYRVVGDAVAAVARYPDLRTALDAAGLLPSDEVLART